MALAQEAWTLQTFNVCPSSWRLFASVPVPTSWAYESRIQRQLVDGIGKNNSKQNFVPKLRRFISAVANCGKVFKERLTCYFYFGQGDRVAST